MKKLLLGTLVLLAFNAAVIITQMSCKKEAKADSPIVRPTTVLYITYGKNADYNNTDEKLICKLDGSNKTKLNITLPANTRIGDEASLTLDGRTVVFDTYDVLNAWPALQIQPAVAPAL
jgi:hypothetical protein